MSRFDLSKSVPILILGDAPDGLSGLARIGHDVAWLLSALPEFQVGYLGRMGVGRSCFPWVSYSFPASAQWGEDYIQDAFQDLAQGRRGIILTIWDATRLLWFADPMGMPDKLQAFLSSGAAERWGLFMQDSEGVKRHQLPMTAAHVMSKYDRVLLASKWAYNVTRNTLPDHPDLDWLPHILNTKRFSPVDREFGRSQWQLGEKEILIGCAMANQERKHWAMVFEAISMMRGTTAGKPKIWCHTDTAMPVPGRGYWNLAALAHEYGLGDRAIIDSRPLSDKEMAMNYSACDATVLISGGEGFGYTIAESLSCGVPCLTGSYGAGAEITTHSIPPVGFRIETQHNVRRALYKASDIAEGLEQIIDVRKQGSWPEEQCRGFVEHLAGDKLGVLYHRWLRRGLQ
jgi:glycosyltransferase involved in cell wall biosynthesis